MSFPGGRRDSADPHAPAPALALAPVHPNNDHDQDNEQDQTANEYIQQALESRSHTEPATTSIPQSIRDTINLNDVALTPQHLENGSINIYGHDSRDERQSPENVSLSPSGRVPVPLPRSKSKLQVSFDELRSLTDPHQQQTPAPAPTKHSLFHWHDTAPAEDNDKERERDGSLLAKLHSLGKTRNSSLEKTERTNISAEAMPHSATAGAAPVMATSAAPSQVQATQPERHCIICQKKISPQPVTSTPSTLPFLHHLKENPSIAHMIEAHKNYTYSQADSQRMGRLEDELCANCRNLYVVDPGPERILMSGETPIVVVVDPTGASSGLGLGLGLGPGPAPGLGPGSSSNPDPTAGGTAATASSHHHPHYHDHLHRSHTHTKTKSRHQSRSRLQSSEIIPESALGVCSDNEDASAMQTKPSTRSNYEYSSGVGILSPTQSAPALQQQTFIPTTVIAASATNAPEPNVPKSPVQSSVEGFETEPAKEAHIQQPSAGQPNQQQAQHSISTEIQNNSTEAKDMEPTLVGGESSSTTSTTSTTDEDEFDHDEHNTHRGYRRAPNAANQLTAEADMEFKQLVHPAKQFIIQLHIGHSGPMLGISSLAVLWAVIIPNFEWINPPPEIYYTLWFIAATLLVVFTFAYIVRSIVFYPGLIADISDYRRANFFAAPIITLANLLLVVPQFFHASHLALVVCFYILLSLQTILSLYIYGEWVFGDNQLFMHIHPLYQMAVVGYFQVASLGAFIGEGEAAFFAVSVGTLFWFLVFFTMLQRLASRYRNNMSLLGPTMFLFLAPPAAASLACKRLGDIIPGAQNEFYLASQFFFYVDLFIYLLLLRLIHTFWSNKFDMSWWAYVFPMCTSASAAVVFSFERSSFWDVVASVLIFVGTTSCLTISAFTIYFLIVRRIPNDEESRLLCYKLTLKKIEEEKRATEIASATTAENTQATEAVSGDSAATNVTIETEGPDKAASESVQGQQAST
eukprot:CAMPEP_0184694432 /NCGR_PEP_ID=MMETSP0313-20130426/2396_1 /TAXON_ID=2792 /ORGANISM="Porphyridium aerugineum, Strain SAG 1380-2" /LENGTH=975 /DNA_ID=CAMNT_0027152725 /DNA_START=295 /DNA_END=3222 /DNA_ORIENTATION=+